MSQQFELFEIANPCIGVCTSNKKGYCFGCLRSRPERQLWLSMTNEQRREVLTHGCSIAFIVIPLTAIILL